MGEGMGSVQVGRGDGKVEGEAMIEGVWVIRRGRELTWGCDSRVRLSGASGSR